MKNIGYVGDPEYFQAPIIYCPSKRFEVSLECCRELGCVSFCRCLYLQKDKLAVSKNEVLSVKQ